MNKKASMIIKVAVGAGILAIAGFTLKSYIGNKVEKANEGNFAMYTSVPVERKDLETYTRGSGLFSSFNTADLKIGEGEKILRQYVNDGESVVANQAVFLVNNGYESSYVKSPIQGLFFERQGENNLLNYQVYDISNTGVTIQVSESNVAKMQIGQSAKVLFTAIDKEVEGQVTYISKIAENGNFPVRISAPYSEDLRFGYNASIKIITASKQQVLCIPYNAVQFEGDQTYVIKAEYMDEVNKSYIITDEMKTFITVGASDSDFVEVTEGLTDGDQVLLGSYY